MAQALQQSQGEMARTGSQGQQSESPQEMTGQDGFNPDGTPKQGGGQSGSQSGGSGKPGSQPGSQGGQGGSLGSYGRGSGGKIPPVGAPTPSKKIDTMVPGQKGKGPELVTPYRGTPDASDPKAAYYNAYPSARRAAEDALNKERIPPGREKQVKEYFEAIQPH